VVSVPCGVGFHHFNPGTFHLRIVQSKSVHQSKPSQLMAILVLLAGTLFSLAYILAVAQQASAAHLGLFATVLLGFKTLVEAGASYYGFALLFTAAAYLWTRRPNVPCCQISGFPPVGVVYLCCDDFDPEAFESLARLQYQGKFYFIVHDDSRSEKNRREVDHAAESLRTSTGREVLLLRREDRAGGKPGASNYVLRKIAQLVEFVLICDNDSTIVDPLTIERALPYFQDQRVAVVQCRNISARHDASCRANRLLSRSIDAFSVFLATYARFGWQPFVGHNALLRTNAIMEVGGFTPGFFSDDLDLTVRLNFAGKRVVYAPEIEVGEKHPPSYESFRRRTYKWAYGCVQTLRAHGLEVIRSKQFSLAEKFSFFQFTGFYVAQMVLLLYLVVTFLVAPWILPPWPTSTPKAFFAGTLIILVTYAPILAYFFKQPRGKDWLGTVAMCGLVYGTSDFCSARGVWDCILGRARLWTPTNARASTERTWPLFAEALFGIALLLIPVLANSPAVFLPAFYLFAGKFLCAPTIGVMYDDGHRFSPAKNRLPLRTAQVAIFFFVFLLPLFVWKTQVMGEEKPGVQIHGKSVLVDGRVFQVKGIHYGPWRPGTGPNKGYSYPSRAEIDSDLILIRSMNANTILVVDPPGDVLDSAQEHGLKVLYSYTIDWWNFGTPADAARRRSILQRVSELRDKPALLGWVLGNEVPSGVLDTRGKDVIRNGLRALYDDVKRLDAVHPVTHSNWPITRDLDLSFLDISSFNVYPLFPPEVVARGFGNYIGQVLTPISGDKPLLITEFGATTIEAGEDGQARLLKSSWQGLTDAGACGGIVFEFADEWWKNYDNPKRQGDWWDRRPDPDDEKRHDLDPEEYYGIVTAERQPRAAAATVKDMFSSSKSSQISLTPSRVIPAGVVLLLIVASCGAWSWARWRAAPSRRGPE
jgi:GT2 family glycosyltransferase